MQRTVIHSCLQATSLLSWRKQLLAGNRVNLAGLGTFFLSIKSEGCDNADDFAAMHIRSVNVRFTPDPELKGLIRYADFEQVSSRKEQANARKLDKQNLNGKLNVPAPENP